jgi:hypothetical protein
MKKWTFDWLSIAMAISYTAFFVSSFSSWNETNLSIFLSQQSIEQMKLDRDQKDHGLIVASNLPRAAEMFQLKTRLESRDFPADKMIRLEAWKELDNTLADYTEKIKFLEKKLAHQQNTCDQIGRRLQSYTLLMGYVRLACVTAVLVFTMMRVWRKKIPTETT